MNHGREFTAFILEVERLLKGLTQLDPETSLFRLHTIKGGVLSWHGTKLAERIHEEEERVKNGESLRHEELLLAWQDFLAPFRDVDSVRGNTEERIVLPLPAAREILEVIQDPGKKKEITLKHFFSPLRDLLRPSCETVEELSREMKKQVTVDLAVPEDIRVWPSDVSWLIGQLIHPMKNAVIHGIEDHDERLASKKDPRGTIRIEATKDGQWLRITVADDGRGVTSSKRQAVSLHSGRSLGEKSLEHEVSVRGGVVERRSEAGKGYSITVNVPFSHQDLLRRIV